MFWPRPKTCHDEIMSYERANKCQTGRLQIGCCQEVFGTAQSRTDLKSGNLSGMFWPRPKICHDGIMSFDGQTNAKPVGSRLKPNP
jgi:hypothetical protein